MARSFKLPDLGEGIHEGEILSIRVSVGDEIKEGDPILEVETETEHARRIYEIEYLKPDGRVFEVEVDAATGEILKQEED